MLGIDVEYFLEKDGLALPAMVGLREFSGKKTPVFKEIATDLQPEGYWSWEVPGQFSKVTEDGLAIETPVTPSADPKTLVEYMREGIRASFAVAQAIGAGLTARPLVHFDREYLRVHPELRVLGCSPDRDLYSGLLECKPCQDPKSIDWRTGGGHIHLSIKDFMDVEKIQNTVFLCDMLLGTADVMIEHSELGCQRREMYGQPGKHRIQKWGIEYRTMSNAWALTPQTAESVLTLANHIHQFVDGGGSIDPLLEMLDFEKVLQAISNCDEKVAGEAFAVTAGYLGIPVTELVLPQNKSYDLGVWL